MGTIRYDVPLVRQGPNPICWIACAAMVLSYQTNTSVTIGSINGGLDPDNSCMLNPARSMDDMYNQLSNMGFVSYSESACVSASYIETLLRNHGPFILTHYAQNFPYGPDWGAITDPNATHAVVITGIDTGANQCYMNNPWGNKDRAITVATVQTALERLWMQGVRSIAYYQG